MCSQSVGIISSKTILKNHPFVENAEQEEAQIQKEKEEAAAQLNGYNGLFNGEGGDNDDV